MQAAKKGEVIKFFYQHVYLLFILVLLCVQCLESNENKTTPFVGEQISEGVKESDDLTTEPSPIPAIEIPDKTSYLAPIVLAHGMGSSKSFNEEIITLFKKEGFPTYTPTVDVYGSVDSRGTQLAEEIKKIVAETGYPKVHIIGHSLGGLDARKAAIEVPRMVASVTSIATPHYGSKIADIALGVSNTEYSTLVQTVLQVMFKNKPDKEKLQDSLKDLSEAEAAKQPNRWPVVEGIYYQSWAGVATIQGKLNSKITEACPTILGNGKMRELKSPFALISKVVGGFLKNLPNDGVVTIASSTHGVLKGCIPVGHLEQTDPLKDEETDFDVLEFYRSALIPSLPVTFN